MGASFLLYVLPQSPAAGCGRTGGIDQMIEIFLNPVGLSYSIKASIVPGLRLSSSKILRAAKMHSEKTLMNKAADKLIKSG
jgi:hypothetical protein